MALLYMASAAHCIFSNIASSPSPMDLKVVVQREMA
ncbi:unnamed protein product [Clonostachys solani]|uniref:Uncharacterized protein n=1 Tax=Clonostachys solani TaxID=160281 RepID=A0A9N9VZE7_9HYPO|nr:unnamed protein product [Clonostachys solani]